MKGSIEIKSNEELELDAIGSGRYKIVIVIVGYARLALAKLLNKIAGLEFLDADAVHGREQWIFIGRVATLEHAVDLLGRGRTLELLSV